MRELPRIRHEVLYGNRLVRCFADRPRSIDAMFRAAVAAFSDRVAVIDEDRRITYAELDERVEAVAAGLVALGYGKGERIALLMGNELEFVVAFLAAARAGLISVPMNTRQRMPEIEFALNQNASAAVIADAAHAGNLPSRDSVPGLRGVFLVGDGGGYPGAEPFEAIAAAATGGETFPEVAEQDTLCLLYTSGTTGKPKGAMLTHLSSVHSVMHFAWGFQLREGDVAFLSVPASHVTGLIAVVLTAIHVGGTTVIVRAFKARRFLELAERERITYSLMVPAMYNLCLLDPDFRKFDLAGWRVAGFGGAPMPQPTIEALARDLPDMVLYNVYGSTETTSPVTMMPAGRIADHADTVGQVLPLADIVVLDDEGREVTPGESGELLIGGPMVVPGYWDNPEGNAKGFTAGYWVSGDVGSKDEEGYVRILDRKKDMINRAGFKVYCSEVEDVLAGHPAVVEGAVVGVPDAVLGEMVHAYLFLDGRAADADEIKRFCAARLSDYKVPDMVTFIEHPLPRNANGKVLKNVLRESTTAG